MVTDQISNLLSNLCGMAWIHAKQTSVATFNTVASMVDIVSGIKFSFNHLFILSPERPNQPEPAAGGR